MTTTAGILAGLWMGTPVSAAETVPLDKLDLKPMTCGWQKPVVGKSMDGNPLRIGGQVFASGVGTHAASELNVILDGGAASFSAVVGVDDEVEGLGSVEFIVMGDGKALWKSGVMKGSDKGKKVEVNLTGVKSVSLVVTDAGDGINFDHADWAAAAFTVSGAKPKTEAVPGEEPVILTPKAGPAPKINGAKVVGVRPGRPFLFRIPATGERPMSFSAAGLPSGLTLDPATGIITGSVAARGSYKVELGAKNSLGAAVRGLRIEVGDRIALTPPMGWNSWNCFAHAVTADKVRRAADAFIKAGLAEHGWSYINIDDFWEVCPGSRDATLQGPERDAEGRILPNPRFPDMKGLTDYIHGLGLKAGLYSSPGPRTCGGCVGSFGFEEQDAASYAAWGFDYLKYDWCSYNGKAYDRSLAELKKPYQTMQKALAKQNRDIVYSLCQYGMGQVSAWGDSVDGNCWRTTGDITDSWASLSSIGFSQAGLEAYAKPGNWNDPDMLIVGHVGWGPALHPTRLTPNEQYTHISLWCLLASPLLIGCDLEQLDEFTLSLLTNDEVLEVNQDPLGRQAGRVAIAGKTEVWAKQMEDGSLAVGLFNRGETAATVTAEWSALGLSGKQVVRDLWRQKEIGEQDKAFAAEIPRHGVALVRIRPAK